MVLGSVRAASRGLRDKASEPDASACSATCPSCPSPRLFIDRKPTPLLPHASRYGPLFIFESYSSHDCDICDLPRFEGDGRGLRFGEHHTPGVSRRDVTPQVV